MTDLDYNDIQPRMRPLVRFLRLQLKLDTCDSGDGVENVEAGMECAVDYPHVTCLLSDVDGPIEVKAEAVLSILSVHGVDGVQVETNYCANDRKRYLFVTFYGDDAQSDLDDCNKVLS